MARPRLRTPELRERFVDAAIAGVEAGDESDLTTRGLAEAAGSSLAALNELFGGKQGLVGAAALTGFRRLADALDALPHQADPRQDLLALSRAHRAFTSAHPGLSQLMYSRPFARFDPGPEDTEAATRIHRHFTVRVASLLDQRRSSPAVVDTAIGLVSLLQGLDHQDRSGTLGSTSRTADRRWSTAISTYIDGAAASTDRA